MTSAKKLAQGIIDAAVELDGCRMLSDLGKEGVLSRAVRAYEAHLKIKKPKKKAK